MGKKFRKSRIRIHRVRPFGQDGSWGEIRTKTSKDALKGFLYEVRYHNTYWFHLKSNIVITSENVALIREALPSNCRVIVKMHPSFFHPRSMRVLLHSEGELAILRLLDIGPMYKVYRLVPPTP